MNIQRGLFCGWVDIFPFKGVCFTSKLLLQINQKLIEINIQRGLFWALFDCCDDLLPSKVCLTSKLIL